MGKITFVIGGARSGKSAYAQRIAQGCGGKVAFIATCKPHDEEMKKRVRLHRQFRPAGWKTFEEPQDPSSLLKQAGTRFDCIIIDCLTILVSNLMFEGAKEKEIENKVKKLLNVLGNVEAESVIVSNEVGLGIVPENKLARDFRDIAGRANQLVAEKADEVFFMVSGLSWRIK